MDIIIIILFLQCGNFEEYYLFAKLIAEETDAKKIILNLSGFECLFDVRTGVKEQTPAILSKSGKIEEFKELVKFLFKNPKLSIDELKKPSGDYRQNDDGSRNLYPIYEGYYNNPDEYIKNKVIRDLNQDLEEMFANAETRVFSSMPNDLEYLRKIVELCEEKNIELLVINSATPLTSRQSYESESYWNFLIQVASTTNFWDFTSYNEINLNPYNFYDDSHPFYEVIDLIIETIKDANVFENTKIDQNDNIFTNYIENNYINNYNDNYNVDNAMYNYSQLYNRFGVYLTKDNVYDYIKQRKYDFYKLKEEFENTGTVKLGDYNDESNLLK